MSDSQVKGVVVIARHGDRLGFFQDPTTYTASDTSITALGTVQEHDLGALLRSIYLNESSPLFIQGIDSTVVNGKQIKVRADTGDEGGVIFDSSIALLQGLFPPTQDFNSSQSDGSISHSPLGGYQYVPSKPLLKPPRDIIHFDQLKAWKLRKTFLSKVMPPVPLGATAYLLPIPAIPRSLL